MYKRQVETCVRKAIERARAELSDECAAFMLVGDADGPLPVSYTHLTLPTSDLV